MAKQYNKPPADLVAQYNKLAKKADRRMRELERFSRYEEFDAILNYAYKNAAKTIEREWTPPGSGEKLPRWQRNMPMDTRSLKAKIKDMEYFMSRKTSTITGVISVYKKRAETINKNYGTNFTWKELANFFDTGFAEKTNDKYGSATVLYAIGKIQNQKEEVVKSLEEKVPMHIQTADITVERAANIFLQYYKKDLSNILN